jgi:transcriptional regulator with XRE-family HTH domain
MKRTKSLDEHIGRRIRERRELLGIKLKDMAAQVGVTYQQHHKREMGTNRISAADLWLTGQVLGVPMTYFVEGFPQPSEAAESSHGMRVIGLIAQVMLAMPRERQQMLAKVARLVRAGDAELGR